MSDGCDFKPELKSYCLTRKAEGRVMVFSVHDSLEEAIAQFHNQDLGERGGDWAVFCVADVIHLVSQSPLKSAAYHYVEKEHIR